MTYSDVNPLDWSTVQPHVDALLATELSRDNVELWLQQWSDLTAVIGETHSQIHRFHTPERAFHRRQPLVRSHRRLRIETPRWNTSLDSQCAVRRRVSSVGESPTRQLSLQPVAIGAVVEATEQLKPPV